MCSTCNALVSAPPRQVKSTLQYTSSATSTVSTVSGITNNAQSWTQIGTYPTGSLSEITTISGDPNIYGQVYVGFQGDGYTYLPAASSGPTISSLINLHRAATSMPARPSPTRSP